MPFLSAISSIIFFVKLRSKNDFPSDCGIASSASSFAALTKCADIAFSSISGKKLTTEELAALSRHGSGSSCRSFYDGFVEWDGADHIRPIVTTYLNLFHQVFIVSSAVKTVSSSQAHQRVATSLLMKGRTERAVDRLQKVKNILLGELHWKELYELSWAEFWDMHALFETAHPPFGYMAAESLALLSDVRELWAKGDGPVVTMDAGPNVHLIWREDQVDLAKSFAKKQKCRVFSSQEPK